MILYLDILIFLIFIILISTFLKNIVLKSFLAIIFSFLVSIDIISILTKNSHINYEFLANVDKSILGVVYRVFFPQLIAVILLWIFLSFIIILCSNKITRLFLNNKTKKFKLGILTIAFLFIPQGFIGTLIKNFYNISENVSKNIEESLKSLEISIDDYVELENISATSGKNIVIIYLESLEQNFMKEHIFGDITPNMNKLKNEWSFYDNYYQTPGSGWTLGALYSTMTGMPANFGLQGNSIFQNVTASNVVSLGQILKKAGYTQKYINGASLSFAGKGKFLNFQGYESIGNEELDLNYSRHGWGVRDLELFEEAKKQYKELSKENKPFNLTLLTVDVHFPNGLPDYRLKQFISSENLGDMEFAVKSTDYLINDFLNFLKNQDNYENTAIFILPDHRLMGSEAISPAVKKLNLEERKLYLLTNQLNIKGYENKNEVITFYEIPRLILNASGVETNAKFIKELIPTIDPFLKKNNYMKKLETLNLSLHKFNKITESITIEENRNMIKIYSGNNIIDNFFLNENDIKYYKLDKELNIKGELILSKNIEYEENDLDLILGIQYDPNGEIEVFIGKDKNSIFKLFEKEYKLFEIGKIKILKNLDKIKISNKDLYEALDYQNDLIYTQKILESSKNINDLFKNILELKNENIMVAISAMDEASFQYENFREAFEAIGLISLKDHFRFSYLALFNSKGKIYHNSSSPEKLKERFRFDKKNLIMSSAGYSSGNESILEIDGKDYSLKNRGLNILIFNKKTNGVYGSFNIDTFDDKNLLLNSK